MADEKRFEDLTLDEIRAGLKEYQQQRAQPAQQPDAPGFGIGDSAASRDVAATLYGQSIMKKQAGALSQQEREFLAASISPALRDLE